MQILESSTRSLKLLPCLICFYPLLIPVRSLSMVCVLISDMRFCWQFNQNYIVRPEFTSILAIEAGRHPIMEHMQKEPVVPNDTFASLSSSFQIITGPNMSGKSTYIRQVALLTIMAHMGSFVPASYASFRLCDQVCNKLFHGFLNKEIHCQL